MDMDPADPPIASPNDPELPPAVDEAEFYSAAPEHSRAVTAGDGAEDTTTSLDQLNLAGSKPALPEDGVPPRTRPGLRREGSVPAPQHLPPPAPPAPPAGEGNPTDSLSLVQLRSLVADMPRVEPQPYAFKYADASSLPEELEEWFSYSVEERAMVLKTHTSFAEEWESFTGSTYEEEDNDWRSADTTSQRKFVEGLLQSLHQPDLSRRLRKLEALLYLVLGCWHESAGLPANGAYGSQPRSSAKASEGDAEEPEGKSTLQIELIKANVGIIFQCSGLKLIYDMAKSTCLRECTGESSDTGDVKDAKEMERRELWCSLTLLYAVLEVGRTSDPDVALAMRKEIAHFDPHLLVFLLQLVSRLRWDDSLGLSLTKILLLSWKSAMVLFGGLDDAKRAQALFRDDRDDPDRSGKESITASPLDYHLFRQEISSKYPAFNPPPSLFPIEPENSSILPPLKNNQAKAAGSNAFASGLANLNGSGTSILNQPVHIATPAPSPPPSPAGPGGKGGKKQNYQTNQLFPFLYPPLDEMSNSIGGKGSTDVQDALVGRKWKGGDIPASILEAAELFAERMRATRAMKQLWEERVRFMKYERGWSGTSADKDIETLDLAAEPAEEKQKQDEEKPPLTDGSSEERLEAVERFYEEGLPLLQSLVIVLLKVILNHVTTLITQASGVNGLQSGFQFNENANGNGSAKPDSDEGQANHHLDGGNASVEEVDTVRQQEILDKAVSGLLILLLKWFKISHILKFEYLTQLLVDSNYIPLILKLLQLQEIERIVNYNCDREDLNFFAFCRAHSRQGATDKEQEEEDAALPPPIRRHRVEDSVSTNPQESESSHLSGPPEVDELGNATTDLPTEPITNFSWRNFFSSINYLRIMQKICKNKAHRNLMLVHYKSSQFLKKSLKVPQHELRLYTLKLFKNQVPYCGRKWRQTNMRVITAVYLHCRPELRDDWLAGSDVDAEVEDSVPLEQALRALTHFYNLKRYPAAMGATEGILDEEQDFFRRELEKMDWGEGEVMVGEDASNMQGGMAQGPQQEREWEAPIQVEGW